MKLFGRGRAATPAPQPEPAPELTFEFIDRPGLLQLLQHIAGQNDTGVLTVQTADGASWMYGFSQGNLIRAEGGRVRGAREAFNLLLEFESGHYVYEQVGELDMPNNLYIPQVRLVELIQRSQQALHSSAPRAAPMPSAPPPGRWQPAAPMSAPSPAGTAPVYIPPPSAPAAPYAGAPPVQSPMPSPPTVPAPPVPPYAPAFGPPPAGAPPSAPTYSPPAQPTYVPPPQAYTPPAAPGYGPPAHAPVTPPPAPSYRPPAAPAPPPSVARAVPPPAHTPTYVPPPGPSAPAPPVPAAPVPPKDEVTALRQALTQRPARLRPGARGRKAGAPISGTGSASVSLKAARRRGAVQEKLQQKLEKAAIRFLVWASEQPYSPDDHWTLKEATDVAKRELKEQMTAMVKHYTTRPPKPKPRPEDEEPVDDLEAGRMARAARRRRR